MDSSQLRVVVCGPVGSGKTTLVMALARHWGLPALEEDMAGLVNAESKFRRLRRTPGIAREQLDEAMHACIAAFRRRVAERAERYAQPGGFVADRWEADMLDFWLVVLAPFAGDELTLEFLTDLQRKAAQLTAVVMLPLQRPTAAVERSNEQQLRRNLRFSASLLNWTVSCGLARQFTSLPVLLLPEGAQSVQERVSEVESRLQQALARHA